MVLVAVKNKGRDKYFSGLRNKYSPLKTNYASILSKPQISQVNYFHSPLQLYQKAAKWKFPESIILQFSGLLAITAIMQIIFNEMI